ncbi:unnamed protein product [Gadus morhua 'NCC']
MSALIRAQLAPGEAAGPGSAIWWQRPLEEPAPNKLDQRQHFLTKDPGRTTQQVTAGVEEGGKRVDEGVDVVDVVVVAATPTLPQQEQQQQQQTKGLRVGVEGGGMEMDSSMGFAILSKINIASALETQHAERRSAF